MKKFLIVISTIVIFFTIFSIKTLAVPLKINYLVKDNKWLNNEIMLEDLDLLDKEWIENNKSRFNGLRKLVESVQKN
ncbi:hypothetical protein [Anaerosalibacter sp. Marseille-P3206]|uniref:hypothetical protein n=1 Tax=Anaerosalibacter sp. Marseille-P3206 TaxID=1871005 RepID=UPI0009856FB3|nr:hypothetical protein [Anaerosalibacter sp. Marseille-P3206]